MGEDYIFAPGSKVFHRCDCKLCLRANTVQRTMDYSTAADGRRPCRVCSPAVPPLAAEDGHGPFLERQDTGELMWVRMVNGSVAHIRKENIIGWCNCRLHRGAVGKFDLKCHNCLEKKCFHFQRNLVSPYWQALELRKQAKEERKHQKRIGDWERAAVEDELRVLKESWQSYLDDLAYDMLIVRVAADSPAMYTIFYVSDNPFADGNRYPQFLTLLRSQYPRHRIRLRHIRDLEGRFVTTDEYYARPKR